MNHVMSYRLALAVTGALLLGACATTPAMNDAGQASVSLTEAQSGTASGSQVVWGGQLASRPAYVDQQNCFIVEARPLVAGARPNGIAPSPGYFVACQPGHFDKYSYLPGRYLTVAGTVDGTSQQMINGHPTRIPTVAINQVHLWGGQPPKCRIPVRATWWDSTAACLPSDADGYRGN